MRSAMKFKALHHHKQENEKELIKRIDELVEFWYNKDIFETAVNPKANTNSKFETV